MDIEDIVMAAPDWEEDLEEFDDILEGRIDTDVYENIDDLRDAMEREIYYGVFN